jgi:AcrR family transcriptional regulator
VTAPVETVTRRRGEALQKAIYEAALSQLAAVGYAKLTMEGVAEAAGTGKAALYRRWPGKQDLLLDVLSAALPRPSEIPQHDTLREDLIALLDCYQQLHLEAHGAAFRALKEDGPAFSKLHEMVRTEVSQPIRALLLAAFERAVERGEARPLAANARVAIIGPALMSYYCMTEQPGMPEGYVEDLVDEVLLPLLAVTPPER